MINIPNAEINYDVNTAKNKIKFEGFDTSSYEVTVLTKKPGWFDRTFKFIEISVFINNEIKNIWVNKRSFQHRFNRDDIAARFLVRYFPNLVSQLKTEFFLDDSQEKVYPLEPLYSNPSPRPPPLERQARLDAVKNAIRICCPEIELSEADISHIFERADDPKLPKNVKISAPKNQTMVNQHGRSIILGSKGEKYLLLTRTKMHDRKLGNGSFKSVKFAINLDTGESKAVAVFNLKKYIEKKKADAFNAMKNCVDEVKIMSAFNDTKRTVHVDSAYKLDTKIYIFMDYCNGGTLRNKIGTTDTHLVNQWIFECARGIQEVHSKGIIHCDIKPDNLLLHDNHVKIADFGLAVRGSSIFIQGTPDYMAPEIERKGIRSPKVDVYSFGCTVFELLTAKNYANEKKTWEDFKKQLNLHPDPTSILDLCLIGIEDKYRELLKNTLNPDPKKRWDMNEVMWCLALNNITPITYMDFNSNSSSAP